MSLNRPEINLVCINSERCVDVRSVSLPCDSRWSLQRNEAPPPPSLRSQRVPWFHYRTQTQTRSVLSILHAGSGFMRFPLNETQN